MVQLLSICTQQRKMENIPLFLLNYWFNYYLVFGRQPRIDSFFFFFPQKHSSSLNSKYVFSDDNRLNMSLENLRKYPRTPGLSLSLFTSNNTAHPFLRHREAYGNLKNRVHKVYSALLHSEKFVNRVLTRCCNSFGLKINCWIPREYNTKKTISHDNSETK